MINTIFKDCLLIKARSLLKKKPKKVEGYIKRGNSQIKVVQKFDSDWILIEEYPQGFNYTSLEFNLNSISLRKAITNKTLYAGCFWGFKEDVN